MPAPGARIIHVESGTAYHPGIETRYLIWSKRPLDTIDKPSITIRVARVDQRCRMISTDAGIPLPDWVGRD
jgi:hypothetical protein